MSSGLTLLIFFSPAIDHFFPIQTCFLQILAHCMYLLFWAILELINRGYHTVWSVGVPAIINEYVLCLSAWHMMADALPDTVSCLEIRGRTVQLSLSRFGLSSVSSIISNDATVKGPLLQPEVSAVQVTIFINTAYSHCLSLDFAVSSSSKFSSSSRLSYRLKMMLNRNTNKCCNMGTTKYLDKCQNKNSLTSVKTRG